MTVPTEAERLAELLASRAAKRIDRNPDWPAGWSLRNLEQFRSDAAAILAAGYRLVGPGEVVMPKKPSEEMEKAMAENAIANGTPAAEFVRGWKGKTRGGDDAEILADDMGGDYPLLGRVRAGDRWVEYRWSRNGIYVLGGTVHALDLLPNRKPPLVRWVVLDGKAVDGEFEQISRIVFETESGARAYDPGKGWHILGIHRVEIPQE